MCQPTPVDATCAIGDRDHKVIAGSDEEQRLQYLVFRHANSLSGEWHG
jgi:hypothetical protein